MNTLTSFFILSRGFFLCLFLNIIESIFQGYYNTWKVSTGARQVRRCHSRASEMAAELIQNDKLKGNYGQKSDRIAFFFQKNVLSCVHSESNLLTSLAEVAFCSRWLADATWFGASLNSCIFNGIITYILNTECAFLQTEFRTEVQRLEGKKAAVNWNLRRCTWRERRWGHQAAGAVFPPSSRGFTVQPWHRGGSTMVNFKHRILLELPPLVRGARASSCSMDIPCTPATRESNPRTPAWFCARRYRNANAL